MSEVTDLQELRKKKRKKQRRKRLIICLLVFVVLFGIYALRDQLNITAFTDFIADQFRGESGKKGFPVSMNGANPDRMTLWGSDICVLTDVGVLGFGDGGGSKFNLQHGYNQPTLRTSSNRALLYERGGKKLRLDSKSKTIAEKTLEEAIFTAALSAKNDIAVATSSERYASEMTVYNSKFEEKFTWSTPDLQIIAVAFSPNSSQVAVSCVSAEGGQYTSTVIIFKQNGTEVGRSEFKGTLIYNLEYKDGSHLIAVGDNLTAQLNGSGEKKNEYQYGDDALVLYAGGDKTVLILGDYSYMKSSRMVVLDNKCGVTLEVPLDKQARGAAYIDGKAYVMTDRNVLCYNDKGELLKSYDTSSDSLQFLVKGKEIYILTLTEIQKITTD